MKRPTPQEFADKLDEAEETMAEHAALHWTCEHFGIDEMAGYGLLVALGDAPPPQIREADIGGAEAS